MEGRIICTCPTLGTWEQKSLYGTTQQGTARHSTAQEVNAHLTSRYSTETRTLTLPPLPPNNLVLLRTLDLFYLLTLLAVQYILPRNGCSVELSSGLDATPLCRSTASSPRPAYPPPPHPRQHDQQEAHALTKHRAEKAEHRTNDTAQKAQHHTSPRRCTYLRVDR